MILYGLTNNLASPRQFVITKFDCTLEPLPAFSSSTIKRFKLLPCKYVVDGTHAEDKRHDVGKPFLLLTLAIFATSSGDVK